MESQNELNAVPAPLLLTSLILLAVFKRLV